MKTFEIEHFDGSVTRYDTMQDVEKSIRYRAQNQPFDDCSFPALDFLISIQYKAELTKDEYNHLYDLAAEIYGKRYERRFRKQMNWR